MPIKQRIKDPFEVKNHIVQWIRGYMGANGKEDT